MARGKMRKRKGLVWLLSMIVAFIVAVGIGGLFTAGTTLNAPILSWLPLIVHQIVGWIVIIGAVISLFLGISEYF